MDRPGEELLTTEADRPVARLCPEAGEPAEPPRRKLGAAIGMIEIISDDEEYLKAFKDYVP